MIKAHLKQLSIGKITFHKNTVRNLKGTGRFLIACLFNIRSSLGFELFDAFLEDLDDGKMLRAYAFALAASDTV